MIFFKIPYNITLALAKKDTAQENTLRNLSSAGVHPPQITCWGQAPTLLVFQ